MSDGNRFRGPLTIAAFLAGAVAVGVLGGVAVASAMGGLRPSSQPSPVPPTPSAVSSVVARVTDSPEPTSFPTPAVSHLPSAEPSASVEVAEGCFLDGPELPERKPTPPIVAKDLRDRLPYLGYFSEPGAYVGSSITEGLGVGYVNGFIACTGADADHIRYGAVSVGSTLGVIPMAAQVDGWTGPQLADVLLYGYVPAEKRADLQLARHDGWTYWFADWHIGIAASSDTVYWFQPFCCVDVGEDAEDLPTFQEIIEDYLDLIDDRPAR